MFPVHVGLTLVEQMEVPLTIVDTGPRRPTEHRLPVVRRQFTVGTPSVEEVVAAPVGRARRGRNRGAEPLVVPRRVVRHEVDEDPDPVPSGIRDELLGFGGGAELLVDLPVVGHVVAAVEQR